MHSCLELSSAATSGVILPSIESKGQLIDMMVQVKTEHNTNTVKGFVGQLREMLDKLVNSQNKHKEVHGKMMKECLEEGKFRKAEIKAGKTAKNRAVSHLAKCKVSLKNALTELPPLQSTHRSYKRELARAQKIRDIEREKYIKRRQEFREAIDFLGQFIAFVNQKLKGYHAASLVSLSEKLLKHSNKLNILSEAAPVLVSIAMEATANKDKYAFTPNERLKQRLVGLLAELFAKIKKDNESNEVDERKAAQVFASYKKRLLRVINTLAINIKRVKKQIVDMKRCIDVEGGIIATASAKIHRNSKLLHQAINMCGSFNKEFIEATLNRLNEIKTMNEILKIVAKRFKQLPKDLIAYLEDVKDGWKKYVNSTAFKKFIEYERKKYLMNKRGALLAKLNADKAKNPLAAHIKGAHGIYYIYNI
jgi:hypothetical protein